MRCVIEMGVYLSRTGSTLNVIWVLGGLELILKIEGGGEAHDMHYGSLRVFILDR